jgi:hypothetical protein
MTNRSVLLTGSNRSGSTWLGQLLGAHPKIRTIHEPLNPVIAKEGWDIVIPKWFIHPPDWNNANQLFGYYERLLRPSLVDPRLQSRFFGKSYRFLRLTLERSFPGRMGKLTLFKDPIALFAAEWLAASIDISKIVVIIRHPASYVVSLIKDNRHIHSFSSVFLSQPGLLDRFYPETKSLIYRVAELQESEGIGSNIVLEGAAFWHCFHEIILQYRKSHPDWNFILYEDIAMKPTAAVQGILRSLELDLTREVEKQIDITAKVTDPSQIDLDSHVKRYNSKDNIDVWMKKLSNDQLSVIRNTTKESGSVFYPEFY